MLERSSSSLPAWSRPLRNLKMNHRLKPNGAVAIAFLVFVAVAALNLHASNSWISFAGCDCSSARQDAPVLQALAPSKRTTTRKERVVEEDDGSYINMTNYQGPSRAFPIYPHPFPCFLVPRPQAIMKVTPASEGFFFQRPYKTGSTTMAGVVMRIARRKAQQRLTQIILDDKQLVPPLTDEEMKGMSDERYINSTFFCRHRSNHGSAVLYKYAERDRQRSFLMTLVRNPTKRCVSQFFHFGVAAIHLEPTNAVFQNYIMNKMRQHPVLSDASLERIPGAPNDPKLNVTLAVENILNGYDFVAVTERFDESLVALKMILKLDFADILYTRNRSGGSFTNGGEKDRPCIYVFPSFVTPGMKQFFKSDKWKNRIRGEILLYQAAWKSLDLTIDRLGRDEFSKQLANFLRINRAAQAQCEPREVGMCTENGESVPFEKRTCIIWSEGCSDACLDEIQMNDV